MVEVSRRPGCDAMNAVGMTQLSGEKWDSWSIIHLLVLRTIHILGRKLRKLILRSYCAANYHLLLALPHCMCSFPRPEHSDYWIE